MDFHRQSSLLSCLSLLLLLAMAAAVPAGKAAGMAAGTAAGTAVVADRVPWLQIRPAQRTGGGEEAAAAAADAAADGGSNWAVLVAGSNTWSNYRHQADVCHAYQILRKHGVPAEQIITMMYDDIANNRENPTPGIIVNHLNGSDVYKGVKIDYREKEVTPENFLKVLKGEGSGKVLKSGPNDNVFINFADHGAPGLVAFPTSVLKAKPLIEALKFMHENKMYKKMVIYVEACESGSMFQKLLPDNINIYATTAANADESSYACYFDKKRGTYLGDLYSVNWMEDSDGQNLNVETLDRQFEIVQQKTTESHVSKFGDSTMGKLSVGQFQGNASSLANRASRTSSQAASLVSQREAPMRILQNKLADAVTSEQRREALRQIRHLEAVRASVAATFDSIVRFATPANATTSLFEFLAVVRYELTDFDCHHLAVEAVNERCFNLGETEEALAHVYKLVNLCEWKAVSTEGILSAIASACPSKLRL